MVSRSGSPWTPDELHVLTAIFMSRDFSIGDSAREECREIADAFERPPAAIDRQWRNIGSLMKGDSSLNIGKKVKEILEFHVTDPKSGQEIATRVAKKNDWALYHLLDRSVAAPKKEVRISQVEENEIRDWATKQLNDLEYRIFPSGRHGYFLQSSGTIPSRGRIELRASCVLKTPDTGQPVREASEKDVAERIRERLSEIGFQVLPSGTVSVYDRSSFVIKGERFKLRLTLTESKNRGSNNGQRFID